MRTLLLTYLAGFFQLQRSVPKILGNRFLVWADVNYTRAVNSKAHHPSEGIGKVVGPGGGAFDNPVKNNYASGPD